MYQSLYILVLCLSLCCFAHRSLVQYEKGSFARSLGKLVGTDGSYIFPPAVPHHPKLSRDVILRGLAPFGYRGDLTSVNKGLVRALESGNLTVVVLGGSVPYGHGLRHRQTESWPAQMKTVLAGLCPGLQVEVVNLAIPAIPSNSQAQTHFSQFLPHIQAAHMVVVDITVNDHAHHGLVVGPDGAPSPRQYPVGTVGRNVEGRLLMELLLGYAPDVGVLYFETFCSSRRLHSGITAPPVPGAPSSRASSRASDGASDGVEYISEPVLRLYKNCSDVDVSRSFHWPVLVEMRIPMLAFPDVACHYADPAAQPADIVSAAELGFWTTAIVHPPEPTHAFLAQVVGLGLAELMSAADSADSGAALLYSTRAEQLWRDYVTATPFRLPAGTLQALDCDANPTTVMVADQPEGFRPASRGSEWSFAEDSPGKWGWISPRVKHTGAWDPRQREIVFSVRMKRIGTAGGLIKLALLFSYEGIMGTLHCCVDCAADNSSHSFNFTHSFDTHQFERTSQTHVVTVAVPLEAEEKVGSVSQHALRCRSNENKVKITGVIGC
jgi:hypothetical protein